MIVLVPKLCLSEAEVRQTPLPMPLTARAEPTPAARAARNPHRQSPRGRLRMIVLAPKLRLSEAELRHE